MFITPKQIIFFNIVHLHMNVNKQCLNHKTFLNHYIITLLYNDLAHITIMNDKINSNNE